MEIKINQTDKSTSRVDTIPKVTGIGGIFFFLDNPKETKEWYAENLGLAVDDYGATFTNAAESQAVWSPFKADSDYFGHISQQFMINYLVDDLDALLAALANKGIDCVGTPIDESYGKFGWIIDCDGRKIELWESKGGL